MTITDPSPEAMSKALTALSELRGANLRSEFNFDIDSAEKLWAEAIGGYDLSDILAAAADWTTRPGKEFPSMGDFLESVRRAQRARLVDGIIPKPKPCEHPPLGAAVLESGEPCRQCVPRKNALWRAGHFDAEHVAAGRCSECMWYGLSLSQVPAHIREMEEARRDDTRVSFLATSNIAVPNSPGIEKF